MYCILAKYTASGFEAYVYHDPLGEYGRMPLSGLSIADDEHISILVSWDQIVLWREQGLLLYQP
jgi:hypothetical protein